MNNRTKKRSVVFTIHQLNQLEKLAAKENMSTSQYIRMLIDKGLQIEGYTENIDLITTIIRQEINAWMTPQVDRIVKIQMKIGKITAGLYYAVLKLLLKAYGTTKSQSLKELATECRKLGIMYMKFRDHEIDTYLEDDDMIYRDIDKL